MVVEYECRRTAHRKCCGQDCIRNQVQSRFYFSRKLVAQVKKPPASEWQVVFIARDTFPHPPGIQFVEKARAFGGHQGFAGKCKENVIATEFTAPGCALQKKWIPRRMFAMQLPQVRRTHNLANLLSQRLGELSFR